MKTFIEKYYNWVFPQDDEQKVSYAGKVFLFCFTIALSGVILFLAVRDIIRNFQAL